MRGIAAAGVYVPRFRIGADEIREAWETNAASGVERSAVPAADEDAVTMAVEAAERALDGVDADDVQFLGVASTTPPADEEMLAPRVVRMLGLASDVGVASSTQSTAAAGELLDRALDSEGPALVVAADAPEGDPADADHGFGAAAAAVLVTDDPEVSVSDRAWHADDYPGIRFRERGSERVESLGITSYERAAVRECVSNALAGLDVDPDDVAGAALYQPDGKLPYRLSPFGSDVVARGTVVDRVGDAGAATTLVGLLGALEAAEDGDATVAAFFGSGGGAVAFSVEGTLDVGVESALDGGEPLSYARYLRERGYVVSGDIAGGGAHVSLPTWQSSLDQRYHLVAGRCPECGGLSFPPEGACSTCHARVEFEPAPLPRRGTVSAYTVIGQGGAPPEFTEQQQRDGAFGVAVVTFSTDDGSAKLPAQVTDADPTDVAVGDEVRAVIRRIYEQEGVPRYGVKVTPVV